MIPNNNRYANLNIRQIIIQEENIFVLDKDNNAYLLNEELDLMFIAKDVVWLSGTDTMNKYVGIIYP